ncbi:hypothetical protein SAY86_009203 [Trapa natans]|uniref:Protein BYPASS-related protein n=1 Tax=Trapa natans TaxID=22666 RepID=A0AAN7KQL3_TRANT|nr:hypothetical protein SAY86_009203 [Trapa natans]
MPATDFHRLHIGRSILGIGRDHQASAATVQTMERRHSQAATPIEAELEDFQRHVTDQFLDLSSAAPDELLSLPWIGRLLDAFVCCQEEFRVILFNNQSLISRPPMDRLIAEFNERTVKALDVCNAIRDGIEQIRQWLNLLEIVKCAVENKGSNLGEGQLRRAKKALVDLAIAMLDEKDSSSTVAHRNRSFGRNNNAGSSRDSHRLSGHYRSLSWSVSRTWSAAKQIQAIGNNLNPPKGAEIVATGGLSVAVFTMSSILLFVMWTLVAAIPCQDRGLQAHFNIPRQFAWSSPVMSLHDRITEESKKRERKNSCGLLREIYQIERGSRMMNEMVDSVQLPLMEEKEAEVRVRVEEVGGVLEEVKEGLGTFERQVRVVFHRIVRSRTEGLDYIGRASSHHE